MIVDKHFFNTLITANFKYKSYFMRLQPLLLVVVLLFIFFHSIAQEVTPYSKNGRFTGIKIGVTPLSLLDLHAIILPVGAEFCYERLGLSLEYGIPLQQYFNLKQPSIIAISSKQISQDTRIRSVLKLYLPQRYDKLRFFFGLEFVHRYMRYVSPDGSFATGDIYSYQNANIRSNVNCYGGIFGLSITKNVFYMDFFAGIGYKHIQRDFLSVEYQHVQGSNHAMFQGEESVNGKAGLPYLSIGAKFGVPLKYKNKRTK